MLKTSIIRIAAALTGALLLAGCSAGFEDPVRNGGPVSFQAGSLLLRDDATKADIKEGNSFDSGDAFSVFGMRNSGSTQSLVFDDVTVTNDSGTWKYSPTRSWSWSSTTDYYDFVAVYPSGNSARMDISGDLAVSTDFDLSTDNYDLLTATYRRKGSVQSPNAIVDLAFSHVTSAVKVVVINNSESTAVSVDAVSFKNLMVVGAAKSTLDLYGNGLNSWINLERSSATVRESNYGSSVAAGSRYECAYDFMIPQQLDQAVGSGSDEANMPRLLLTYTPEGGSQSTADIC
nr:fimbrillin family protein [Bacteroidales bacterium]